MATTAWWAGETCPEPTYSTIPVGDPIRKDPCALKFDVILPGTNHIPGLYPWSHTLGADGFRRILRTLDEAGFHAVSVSEHLAMPLFEVPRLGAYWQDALSTMAFAAAATDRIRLDAAVLVLPYHHPLRLAKSLATIDVLSGGRVNVSIGVGHAEQEFAAMGVPFQERGAIADEILEALNTLWTAEHPEHHGKYFEITGLAVDPQPVQQPRPPIYVGGNSAPALRRAARHDGWQPNPTNFTVEQIPPLLDYIREQPDYVGKEESFDINWLKSPAGITLSKGFDGATASELNGYRDQLIEVYRGRYRKIGITRTVAEPPRSVGSEQEYLHYLGWFAEEVMPEV
ncbi:TIGR03619 family F420-dependent LLM class oxidoreductase [Nocardia rhamnosiphila]|uniref:TIGR03619 family F420-dependent LLM class oxidoreductase n=1 Tax=Nocardia rhamnosiphila TaxID=426716 RepID=UPI0033E7E142